MMIHFIINSARETLLANFIALGEHYPVSNPVDVFYENTINTFSITAVKTFVFASCYNDFYCSSTLSGKPEIFSYEMFKNLSW